MHIRVTTLWSWSRRDESFRSAAGPTRRLRVLPFDARASQPREAPLRPEPDRAALRHRRAISAVQRPTSRLAAPKANGARRVLDRLKQFLDEQTAGALPKSQYGQAIGYVRNSVGITGVGTRRTADWRSTTTFRSGRSVSPQPDAKIGYFSEVIVAAKTAAICLSILASAKRCT